MLIHNDDGLSKLIAQAGGETVYREEEKENEVLVLEGG